MAILNIDPNFNIPNAAVYERVIAVGPPVVLSPIIDLEKKSVENVFLNAVDIVQYRMKLMALLINANMSNNSPSGVNTNLYFFDCIKKREGRKEESNY